MTQLKTQNKINNLTYSKYQKRMTALQFKVLQICQPQYQKFTKRLFYQIG